MGLEDLFLRWLILIDGKFVLPFGSRFQFLPHGFSIVPRTAWVFSWCGSGFPNSWSQRTKMKLHGYWEQASFPQCPIGYTGQPYSVWEGRTRTWMPRDRDPWGSSEGQIGHIVCFLSMHKNSVQVLLSSFYRWGFVSLPKTTKLSNSKQVCLTPEPVPLPLYSATSQQTGHLGT